MDGLYNGLENGLVNGLQDGLLGNEHSPFTVGILNRNHPLANGLISYFRLNDYAGNKAKNLAGNAGTLTGFALTGTTSNWIAQSGAGGDGVVPSNSCVLNFDGSGDYISISQPFLNGGAKSISVWVNVTIGGDQFIIDGATSGSFGFNPSFRVLGTGALRFWNYDASFNLTSTGTISGGKWYHVVASWDGTTSKIYINNRQSGSATGDSSILVAGATWQVGHSNVLGGYFNGSMSELRTYNVALTKTQIEVLYNNPHIDIMKGSIN